MTVAKSSKASSASLNRLDNLNPANIYLCKAKYRKLEKGMKYIQS